jgi:GMP reductase
MVEDMKLDFKDVLIMPQLTALSSRRSVNLSRKFTFRHHDTAWEGIPIMAANMDTVGTFEIAEEFAKNDMITCM